MATWVTHIAGNDRLFCDVLPGKEPFACNTGCADPDVHLHATLPSAVSLPKVHSLVCCYAENMPLCLALHSFTSDDPLSLQRHCSVLTKFAHVKPPDTVGEPRSAEICVSHMPSWKAKTLGKLTQEKVLLEPGSRFANSIPPFSLDKSTSSLTEARTPRQGSDKTDYRNLGVAPKRSNVGTTPS